MEKMIMKNPPHPGEILKYDYLVPLDLTISHLAEVLHVSRKTLSQIVNEKSAITPAMAIRLSKAFGTSPMYWIGMQEEYDMARALASEVANEDIQSLVG